MKDPLAVAEIGGTSVRIGFADGGVPLAFARTSPTAAIRTADPAAALAALIHAAAAALFSPAGRLLRALPDPYRRRPPEIRWASLGWRAAIHGALLLAAG